MVIKSPLRALSISSIIMLHRCMSHFLHVSISIKAKAVESSTRFGDGQTHPSVNWERARLVFEGRLLGRNSSPLGGELNISRTYAMDVSQQI